MKKVLILGGLVSALSIFLNSTNYLYSDPNGAPAARTGPHTNKISIVGDSAFYTPGVTYSITTNIVNPTGTAGGFQLVALSPAKASIGTFTPATGNKVISASGRSYMTHSNKNNRSWTFKWKAPAAATAPDSVTFYAACMETVSGNYKTYTTKLVFHKKPTVTGVEEVVKNGTMAVFPTMATDKISVRNPRFGQLSSEIQILGIDGKEYVRQNLNTVSEESEIQLPADMKPGPYLVRLLNQEGIQIRRIVKL
ncbi:MAG TPA: Reeler domain-containing protein [Catalimonadaceae bacterium]|nr:Reeler domain-containing protein [Catalimonadaceae bacterium]